jgi:hypothetical protein
VFVILTLLMVTLGATQAPAQDNAIVVVASAVEGQVTLFKKDGTSKFLAQGDQVNPTDTIESAAGGKAVLTLNDGSKLEIFEGTRVEVNELLPEEPSKFSASLFFGRVSARLKKLRGDDVVITPTMVAGVRGTDFTVSVVEDGTSVVTVDEGHVEVSTDKAWDQTDSVTVKPGQEVVADKSGAELIPRPISIKDLADWTKFREARLEAMKADLPSLLAMMEKGVDPNLAILDKIKAMPVDRSETLKKLDMRLKELGPADVAERAKLTIQTHMEAGNVLGLVKRFRVQRMRLRSTFERGERLQSLLPTFSESLGPEYKSVDEGLKRILARKAEVEEQERKMSVEFKDAVAPSQPLLNKYKKFAAPGTGQ